MPFGWIAAATIGSSLIGANAAGNAADTQANAANNASAQQMAMFQQTKADVAPWIQAGQGTLSQLTAGTQPGGAFMPSAYTAGAQQSQYGAAPTLTGAPTLGTAGSITGQSPLSGSANLQNVSTPEAMKAYQQYTMQNQYQDPGNFTMDKFHEDPGYQFQLAQGQNALTNASSLSGGMNSNNLKGLLGYSQGLANQDYQQAFGNYQTEAARGLNAYQTNLQDYKQQFGLQTQITGLNNQNITQNLNNQIAAAGFNNNASQTNYMNSQAQQGANNALAQQQYQDSLQKLGLNNEAAQQTFANQNAVAQQGFQNANTVTGLNNQVTNANNLSALQLQQLNNANKQQGFNNLSTLSQAGQNAAVGVGNQAVTVGGQIGSNIIGAGNAQAAGQIGTANALAGGLGQGYNAWLQQQYMNPVSTNGFGAAGYGDTSAYSAYAPTAAAAGGWGIE